MIKSRFCRIPIKICIRPFRADEYKKLSCSRFPWRLSPTRSGSAPGGWHEPIVAIFPFHGDDLSKCARS